MSFINDKTKEINCKIIYFGPSLSGKSTTLRNVYNNIQRDTKGELVSISESDDKTLYFDFVPINLGKIKDYTIRLHLYTAPGDAAYESARKLISKGVDGIVFVADSQLQRMEDNLNSLTGLKKVLNGEDMELHDIPIVFQYNKRDLPNAVPASEMSLFLNKNSCEEFETVAINGQGILEALRAIGKKVLMDLKSNPL